MLGLVAVVHYACLEDLDFGCSVVANLAALATVGLVVLGVVPSVEDLVEVVFVVMTGLVEEALTSDHLFG